MSEWQPIETAPKDGALVLLFQDSTIPMLRWVDTGYFIPGHGWYWCRTHCTDNGPAYDRGKRLEGLNNVTHWMPLPSPPVTD